MTDRAINPPLIWAGALLALFGAVVLVVTLLRGQPVQTDRDAPAIEQTTETNSSSFAWPIVAGLSLAVGAGCIGIGMNRWRAAA
jgi:hypothetical protein